MQQKDNKFSIILVITAIVYCFIVAGVLLWYFSPPVNSSNSNELNTNRAENQEYKKSPEKKYAENKKIVEEEVIEEIPSIEYPKIDINFTDLYETNKDFVGVIYIPALKVKEPVVKSLDNEEYLHKMFDGKKDERGCIFLEKSMPTDFSLPNTFIYGHNRKNGEMFGCLKRFLNEEKLCDSDPYVYIYTSREVYKYRIFAYYTIPVNDDLYKTINYDEYDSYIEKALNNSMYKEYDETIDFSNKQRILTLSTCYGTGHKQNFVVHGALEGVGKIK